MYFNHLSSLWHMQPVMPMYLAHQYKHKQLKTFIYHGIQAEEYYYYGQTPVSCLQICWQISNLPHSYWGHSEKLMLMQTRCLATHLHQNTFNHLGLSIGACLFTRTEGKGGGCMEANLLTRSQATFGLHYSKKAFNSTIYTYGGRKATNLVCKLVC